MTRQSGVTTRHMREAPQGAIYVWVNGHLNYPKALAQSLGRSDLEIQPPSWLSRRAVAGLERPVVIDHAFWWFPRDSQNKDAFDYLVNRGLLG